MVWQQLFRLFPYSPAAESGEPPSSASPLARLRLATFLVAQAAVRRSARSPGFSAVVVIVLAIGIGANATVFLLLDAVLLRPLPYPDSARLLHITAREPGQDNLSGCLSYAHFLALSQPNAAVSGVAGYVNESFTLTTRGAPALRLEAARISSNFLSVLSVHPLLGRAFVPAEDKETNNAVVMLGERLWRQRFASDPAVLGRPVYLDTKPYTVVGIMPDSFQFEPLGTRVDVWAPSLRNLSLLSPQQVQAGACYLNAIARLAPGSSGAEARAGLAVYQAQFLHERVGAGDADPKRTLEVLPLSEKLRGNYRPLFLTFAATVFLFLMIAGANVAGLSLARAIERRKEVALRVALGATRLYFVADLMAENLLLALVGGLFGLALSLAAANLSRDLLATALPELHSVSNSFSWRLFGFSAAISAFTGIACGIAPACHFGYSDLSGALRESGRGAIGGRWHNLSRNTLIVGQIAISVLLLIAAGHLTHSFLHLKNQPLGFESQSVLTMNLTLPQAKYPNPDQMSRFFSAALARTDALPGVQASAVSSALPVNESRLAHVLAEGQPPLPVAQRRLVALQTLSPSYLRVFRIPLVKGRFFTLSDTATSNHVAVVNRTFARLFFRGPNPIGKHIWLGKLPTPWEVVGIIDDIKNVSLSTATQAELDLPFSQLPWPQMNLAIRARTAAQTSLLAGSVQSELAKQDREQPVTGVQTLEELLSSSRSQPRVVMAVLTVFAALAFLVASIGIYSVVSYYAAQRMPEFGVRLALGASRPNVALVVLKQTVQISALGIGIGLVSAFALTRVASSVLYGLNEFDPWSFLLAPGLFFIVALLATLYPALRVTRLKPADVLRAA